MDLGQLIAGETFCSMKEKLGVKIKFKDFSFYIKPEG
jgi:hypothetical protein